MARWNLKISGKHLRKATVEKIATEILKKCGENCDVLIEDAALPESRSDRFSAAQSLVNDAKEEFESLLTELEDWKSNLPDNLQDSNKACELDDAISGLEEACMYCENAVEVDVNFPGMFG